MSTELFDIIVVGSGAGGSAATRRLVEAGRHVLLLEKGGELLTDGSTLDVQRVVHAGEFMSREPWVDREGGALRPEEHFNVGGKTRWYGAALLRLSPHEFEPDAAHRCPGWPISYGELEPYYAEAERLLEVVEFDREADLARICAKVARPGSDWRALPMSMGLAPGIRAFADEAAHFDGFASVRGLKADAEHSLLEPIRRRRNLRLETSAEVVALSHAPGAPAQVNGVVLNDGRRFEAPRVVLAAGALHSPRLLERHLATTGLAQSLPMSRNLGCNLKLHLLTAMVAVSPSRKTDLIRKTTVLLNERFRHSSVQPLGFDAQLIATLIPRAVPRVAAHAIGARAYGFFLQTEDGSDPRNRVYQHGASLPVLDYDVTRLDASRLEHRAFTRSFQGALAGAGFVSFTQRIGLNGTAHACGTMIAGHDPVTSVVDASGAVHGMDGIFVADGSVLPRSSRVNPSLSIYAWGLRLGDLLARQSPPATRGPSIHASLARTAGATPGDVA